MDQQRYVGGDRLVVLQALAGKAIQELPTDLDALLCSEAEAVEVARRKLGRELPRLYDLIRELEKTRFRVERAA